MKQHIPIGDGVLCGQTSLAAWVNTTDCKRCLERWDAVLDLLFDAALGLDVSKRAADLVGRWGLTREDA
jgi:hypothetical protein